MTDSTVVVIPCRIGSTRFPRKPLAMIAGRAMVNRVWAIAKAAKKAEEVIVATDSEELADFCRSFGAEVALTGADCRTGTDRVAEVARALRLTDSSIVINLQGDAALTPPWLVDDIIVEMKEHRDVLLATPMVRLAGEPARDMYQQKKSGNTTGTLVTFDINRNALYFSKNLIPNLRDGVREDSELFLHVGLYGYRADLLQKLSGLPYGRFEKFEQLEQLRALENGIPIRMVEVDLKGRSLGSVDNPDDVQKVEIIIAREGELV